MLLPLECPYSGARSFGQGIDIQCNHIGHGVHFRVSPDVLNGVEFGGIGWKIADMKTPMLFAQLMDLDSSVRRKAVPDDDDRARQFLQEILEEGLHGVRVDIGAGMQAEVKTEATSAGQYAQGGNDGDLFVRTGSLIQQRGLPLWAPCAPDERRHHQAAFVDEDEVSLQAGGFFLMRGQSSFTHCAILSSSRSTARRSGFWGLHPRLCRRRPT